MEGGLRLKGKFNLTGGKAHPLVSIITVTYNAGKLLEETIFSIQNQTYKNIEHIIIDAFSKDDTLEYIKKYEDNIAYWKSEKDKGIYDGMNKGLEAATGDYVWFLNAGDIIECNDTLEKVIKVSGYADILYGETNLINEQGEVLGTRTQLTTRKLPDKLKVSSFKNGMIVNHQAIIVKRSIAEKYNLKYKIVGDYDWAIRCVKNAKTVANTHLILSRFLQGGISTQKNRFALRERFKASVSHFGLPATIYHHLLIVWRNIIK